MLLLILACQNSSKSILVPSQCYPHYSGLFTGTGTSIRCNLEYEIMESHEPVKKCNITKRKQNTAKHGMFVWDILNIETRDWTCRETNPMIVATHPRQGSISVCAQPMRYDVTLYYTRYDLCSDGASGVHRGTETDWQTNRMAEYKTHLAQKTSSQNWR